MRLINNSSLKIELKLWETFTCLLLLLLAAFLTIFFDSKFNPDLRNSIKILDYMADLNFQESIFENSVLFFILQRLSIFLNTTNADILNGFYVLGQTIFITVLLRYFKPIIVLEIILFTFFTVVLNQIRFALSISLVSYLVYLDNNDINQSNVKRILFLILILASHLFAGLIFIIFLLVKWKPKLFSVGIFSLIGLVPIVLSLMDETRFLFYLNEDADRGSFTFIFIILFVGLLFKYLTTAEKYYFSTMTIVVTLLYSLPSISSRIAEFNLILLFLLTNKYKIDYLTKTIILILVISFFIYRSYSWFVLNAIPEPV
jgi:hypothetical protein